MMDSKNLNEQIYLEQMEKVGQEQIDQKRAMLDRVEDQERRLMEQQQVLWCLFFLHQLTVRRVFFQTNICGHCYWFFWLQWAGNLAVAGLNLLAQISDVMSSKDWQGISQLFGSFFCYRFCISQICS